MKTIITLEGVPFESFEQANFIGSLFKLFNDFNIPKENIEINNDIIGRQYSMDKFNIYESLIELGEDLGRLGFRHGLRFKEGIYYRNNDNDEWKKLY